MGIKKYIPDIFNFYLRIPFIEIHISLFSDNYNTQIYNYLVFDILIYKWKFKFNLGLSNKKIYERFN